MKTLLKNIFRYFGFEVRRTRRNSQLAVDIAKYNIDKFELLIPSDHALPEYIQHFPNYSSNLPRIVKHCEKFYSNLILVDIGANVGDTVALVRSASNCTIVCIEGDPAFYSLLSKNLEQFNDVHAYNIYLSATSQTLNAKSFRSQGTLNLVSSGNGNKIDLISFDQFIQIHKEFSSAKILKIDTDGFDFLILRGALNFIKCNSPILFFEYDPYYFKKQNENHEALFDELTQLGYQTILVYDNYGNLLLSLKMNDIELLRQLTNYIEIPGNSIKYYDLCIIHRKDIELFYSLLDSELNYFQRLKKNYDEDPLRLPDF